MVVGVVVLDKPPRLLPLVAAVAAAAPTSVVCFWRVHWVRQKLSLSVLAVLAARVRL